MHRWSKLFIPTLREAPADAEVASHKFLLRAGYIRQVGAGIYSYLFLGQRSINKIQAIVREEMDRIAQEFLLPALHPRELWEESGRWAIMGQNLFKLQDRKGAWLVLGMTEEEVMTDIARKELRSYKQLPQIWYQIQTKFRDEPRPRAGLLRVRQFIMKDSYSFDLDAAGLDVSYNKHDAAYRAILRRSGLNFVAVQADSGAMGGSQSQEFMVYAEAGEDLIASCPACNYAANLDKATSQLPPVEDLPGEGAPELVHTPGQRTIEAVGAFLQLEPIHQIKTMAYVALTPAAKVGAADIASPVVVLLRGDHTLNQAKLAGLFPSAREIRPMGAEEILNTFHSAGWLPGPDRSRHPGRRRAGRGRESDGHSGSCSRGAPQSGRRRQPGGISSAQCDAGPGFCSHPDRRCPQRHRRGKAAPNVRRCRAIRSRWPKPSRWGTFSSWATGIRMAWGSGYWTPMARK